MDEKQGKLPTFKNDDAFADFVDTHDMADYWDEFEDVEIQIEHPQKAASLFLKMTWRKQI